ncbi:hypothetical protein [Legionella tunisiensis]|uniref:hypothetical protein n=1 Tax=Legionella tunisiensis TaxID=1034944 RepID=UPI0003692B4A|nr:hypothetical protein [Legionella tunisiensis]
MLQAIQGMKEAYFTMANLTSIVASQDIEMVNKVILGLVDNIVYKLGPPSRTLPLDYNTKDVIKALLNLDLFIKNYKGDKTHPLIIKAFN